VKTLEKVLNLTTLVRRYWAIRTDRNNKKLLLGELHAGRLRQGWGSDASQDLRLIQEEIVRGGKWWARLTETQKQALPQLKMLAASEGGVQVGDWVLTPNLPDDGYFLIAEVTGDYYFDRLLLTEDTNINDTDKDYGHILPVRLITKQGINWYAKEMVSAPLRSQRRPAQRMWNLDYYKNDIEQLVERYRAGGDPAATESGNARLQTAWTKALSRARELLQERLGSELDARFQAAEWEEPIRTVLQKLYPRAYIRWVAGSMEYGADIIVQLTNHFGGLPWLIVVQVKNYTGEIGPQVLLQLKTAYNRYTTDGKILVLVVMTTAEKLSEGLTEKIEALEKELAVPVKFVLRKEMMGIMSRGLMTDMNDLVDVPSSENSQGASDADLRI
jgi:hypothetical protein